MNMNTIMILVLTAITVMVGVTAIYFYIRDRSLNDIRADVYQLFLKAENDPELMGIGKKKMRWVLSQVRNLLPGWLQVFLTDDFLEKIVEGWFRAVKDLLDDGRLNKSQTEVK